MKEEIPELPLSDFFVVTAFKDVAARLQLVPASRRPPDWQLYVCQDRGLLFFIDDFGEESSQEIIGQLQKTEHVHLYEAIADDDRPLPSVSGLHKLIVNPGQRLKSLQGDVLTIEGYFLQYLEFLLNTQQISQAFDVF